MSLKVLHCVHRLNDSDGGPSRSIPALAAAQAKAGADVLLWTSQQPMETPAASNSDVARRTGPLDQIVSEGWRPDVIHDHGLWLACNRSAASFALRHRIPRVVSPRGMLSPWCLSHHRFRKSIAWRIYQRRDLKAAAALHATSSVEAQDLRHLGFRQHFIQIPNGVSLPAAGMRFTTDLQKQRREILFLSRLHPVKGLMNLIVAWAQCCRKDWVLRIVGSDYEGHREKVLEAIRREPVLNDSVVLQDAVSDQVKWQVLSHADVLILPSYSENFGIVCAEALAVGTPVITTTGTPWNQIEAHRCGWYVDPDVHSLKGAIESAMNSSPDQLQEMGVRGRVWVEDEFNWDRVGARMLDAYEDLLGKQLRMSRDSGPVQRVAA